MPSSITTTWTGPGQVSKSGQPPTSPSHPSPTSTTPQHSLSYLTSRVRSGSRLMKSLRRKWPALRVLPDYIKDRRPWSQSSCFLVTLRYTRPMFCKRLSRLIKVFLSLHNISSSIRHEIKRFSFWHFSS